MELAEVWLLEVLLRVFLSLWPFSYSSSFHSDLCFYCFLSIVLCQLCFTAWTWQESVWVCQPLPSYLSGGPSVSFTPPPRRYIWSSSCACAVFLTVWSWSCQWSTGPPVGPWACCQSQHPPAPESGTRGTCSSPPAAGVWSCRAS